MRNILSCIIILFFCVGFSYSQSGSPSTLPDIKYHLTARPWHALNISRSEYLTKVERVVRAIAKFQDSTGAIIDPYAYREVQYSTPFFANAVATLISAGRATDMLPNGVAAMNCSTADIAGGRAAIPDNHGEFFIAPLANAIPLYTPYVSASQLQTWKTRMAKPIANIIKGSKHNWRTYAMKGEWYRAKNGYVNKDSAVKWVEDSWIKTQRDRITNNLWSFYHDSSSNPDTWAYESVARSNLLAMIADGYSGASRNEMLTLLKRGTQSSLLLQDPSGQIAAGGRSGNHTWTDILLANGYETMAEMVYKEGDTRLAGQYRHAAALAFQSVQRWRRTDGAYSITKNFFDPKAKIGYASYSYFANYNGSLMYHIAENYLRHKTTITEQPTPDEIGGFTIITDTTFATAVANAGGMQMEVCLRGSTKVEWNRYWTALGVVRFARPGWDSRLGPSDGIRDTASKLGVSFAPTFLENGSWLRLASIPERYEAFFTTQFAHPLLVRCRILYKPKADNTGPTFTNNFIITPDGILSTLTSSTANFGITWPVLTFDGATNLTTSTTSHIVSTSFPGQADKQNFIALHSSPTITTTGAVKRSSYGDLRPVRMVSGSMSNITFIYPSSSGDPSADSVRKSFTSSGIDFSTILGRVKGNTYVGRTAAGGVGTSLDINNDSKADVTFNMSTGFVMQLQAGKIIKIETDRDVTGIVYGQTLNLKAYTPYNVIYEQINSVMLEAEDAVLGGAIVASDHADFTGTGFADYKNASGDFIEWTFNTSNSGSYSLKFRYANAGTTDRPLKLEVNGKVIATALAFLPTGNWTTWSVSSATANLISGANKIKLTAIGYSGPNLDHLSYSFNSTQSIQKSVPGKGNLPASPNFLNVHIVPNPASNILNIQTTGLQNNKQVSIFVIFPSGATMKIKQSTGSTNVVQLDVSSLAAGLYTIKLIIGDKVLYKQFVKL